MRRLVLLALLILTACSGSKIQNTNHNIIQNYPQNPVVKVTHKNYPSYRDLWQKVLKLQRNGLTKSADTLVREIYTKAKKDQNSPQIIKALLYRSKYMMRLEEDSQLHIIHNFEKEIVDSETPSKQVLESYLAQLFWLYYKNNRWKFAHRSETAQVVDPADFRTWDLKTLYKTVYTHFKRSLRQAAYLKAEPVSVWKDILKLSDKSTKYQPTLYDVLIHEALSFYENKENALTAPAQNFSLDNPEYLSDVEQFISLKTNTKDSLSKQYQALLLYQNYLQFRLSEKQNFDALAYADLQRLQFVYNNAVFQNKAQFYRKALQNFVQKYKTSDIAALAYYRMANLLNALGDKYVPGQDDKYRWYKKEAVAVCETAIKKYPESDGAKNCANLSAQITAKQLNIEIEKYVPENEPVLIKINFKNIVGAGLKIYSLTHLQMQQIYGIHEAQKKRRFVEQFSPVKTYAYNFPDLQDYHNHSTERILDGLPNGEYALLLTTKDGQDFGLTYFQVTDVAIQTMNQSHNQTMVSVLNRQNGLPVTGAQVVIKQYIKQNWKTVKKLTVNDKGNFSISNSKKYYGAYLLEVHYANNRTAYFQEYFERMYLPDPPHLSNTAFIFTDRSIYRPGQILYYKAICLKKTVNHSKVLNHIPVHVKLYDVNHQKIAEKNLTTNDFGSIHGEFILPDQGLTGLFTLEISSTRPGFFNTRQIRVEAYKRPKFEVKLNQPEQTYKVGDTIPVTGVAESFAGSKITGAMVTYRIHREVIMPRWWYWFRPAYRSQAQEIAHGTTLTDEKGRFSIKFKALPDRSIKPENEPVFHYKIYAEITDLNGETHTKELYINAGYKQMQLHLDLPEKFYKNQTDSIRIESTNLNGVKVPADVTLQIYKLKAPDRVLRSRPWNAPDIQSIDKATFINKLPYIPYDRTETNTIYWPKGKLYREQKLNTKTQEKLAFTPASGYETGHYIVIATAKDKDGQEVKTKQWFEIVDKQAVKVAEHRFFKLLTDKDSYQPGDKLQLKIGSASKGNRIRLLVEKNHKIILQKDFISDGTFKTIKVPVTEKDYGGFVVHCVFNAFNNFKINNFNIKVPYPSDRLQIETVRFRDKLKPGQEEEWRFTIKGPKSQKVSAEILASMYDASLDQFTSNSWDFSPVYHMSYRPVYRINQNSSFGHSTAGVSFSYHRFYTPATSWENNRLEWFDFRFGHTYGNHIYYRTKGVSVREGKAVAVADDYTVEKMTIAPAEADVRSQPTATHTPEVSKPAIRSNFNETAFFYPELYTDKDDNVGFRFTAPESLTKWKLQLLAHSKDLKHGYQEFFAQTQKDLMVFPNAPRFVRQGDTLIFSTKISNLSSKSLSGIAELSLKDAVSQKDVTNRISKNIKQSFSIAAEGNTQVQWQLIIPDDIDALVYTVKAKAGNQTDAEQNFVPVLSNRMPVTETMPMWVRSGQTKTFTMDKLLHPRSNTLKNHRVTLEITSNPAWYALQALPYLMEYPYECSEQIFSRYYANTLAAHIVKQNPKIKQVFDVWKNYQSDALLSNLEKNQELKNILIEETPWLRDAQNETEQKKRIALLFDLNKMASMQQTALQKLKSLQLPSGGFTWFKGGRYPNRYITQHIVAGFGHLKHLGIVDNQAFINSMLKSAIAYLDNQIRKDYEDLLERAGKQKDKQTYLQDYKTGAFQLHYLYTRSFYPEENMSQAVSEAVDYYRQQAQKHWLMYGLYEQGLLALVSHRHKDTAIAKKIVRSLDENSIKSEEMGMYWKNNTSGWYWHQAPIETQALLIEAFDAIEGDVKKIDEMRIWLLKHKQTNAWKTTKQTTEAVYALLLRGTDFLAIDNSVRVKIGNTHIEPAKMPEIKTEAGTGYFKKSWTAEQIIPGMGKVSISKKAKGIAWGALYWQYFEDMDKITGAKTPVSITKKLFVRKFTDAGEILQKIDTKTKVHTGDLIRVRIEIKVDRDMEYVHLKDMRAGGFEPVNVLSRYKWQDGLGYYEATGDTATNFFIDYLPKGVYVFEYDLRANNAGNYSNGITQLQCMYAPEFSSHSKGVRVSIW